MDGHTALFGAMTMARERGRATTAASSEIDRVVDHPGFVQVLAMVWTSEPMGRRKYWKIYEAAERHGLPVGLHLSGTVGNPIALCRWPSYYIDDHTDMVHVFQQPWRGGL